MKSFLSFRNFVQVIVLTLGLSVLTVVPLSCQMGSSWVSQITGDDNFASAVSLVKDSDFNVTNNLPPEKAWKISETGNHLAPIPLSGFAWWPFFSYTNNVLNALDMEPNNCFISNEQVAYLIGNIFFLFFYFFMMTKLLSIFNLGIHLKTILLVSLLGTPLFYYAFFETAQNLVLLLTLITAQIFLLKELESRKYEVFHWILTGVFSGIIFLIDESTIYFALGPLIHCLFRSCLNFETLKFMSSFILGFGGVYLINLQNLFLAFGGFSNQIFPLKSLFETDISISDHLSFGRSLLGPNGSLFLTPIYALSAIAIVKFLVDLFESRKSLTKDESLIMSFLVAGILSILFNPKLFYLSSEFGSGHFLAQQALLCFGVPLFLRYVGPKLARLFKFLFFPLALWNILGILQHMADRKSFGLSYPNFSQQFFVQLLRQLQIEIEWSFAKLNILSILGEIFYLWCPFIIICYFLYTIIKRNGAPIPTALAVFFSALFVLSTLFNSLNNSKNALVFSGQQQSSNRVVGYSFHRAFYDDYMATSDYLKRYFDRQGRNDETTKLLEQREFWARRSTENITSDPIKFKENVERKQFKPTIKKFYLDRGASSYNQCSPEQ